MFHCSLHATLSRPLPPARISIRSRLALSALPLIQECSMSDTSITNPGAYSTRAVMRRNSRARRISVPSARAGRGHDQPATQGCPRTVPVRGVRGDPRPAEHRRLPQHVEAARVRPPFVWAELGLRRHGWLSRRSHDLRTAICGALWRRAPGHPSTSSSSATSTAISFCTGSAFRVIAS